MQAIGDRLAVYEGRARATAGGLKRADLFINPATGAISSRKQAPKAYAAARRSGAGAQFSDSLGRGGGGAQFTDSLGRGGAGINPAGAGTVGELYGGSLKSAFLSRGPAVIRTLSGPRFKPVMAAAKQILATRGIDPRSYRATDAGMLAHALLNAMGLSPPVGGALKGGELAKVVDDVQTAARMTNQVISSPELNRVANSVSGVLRATGTPHGMIAAQTIDTVLPIAKTILGLIAPRRKRTGAVVPFGQALPTGQLFNIQQALDQRPGAYKNRLMRGGAGAGAPRHVAARASANRKKARRAGAGLQMA